MPNTAEDMTAKEKVIWICRMGSRKAISPKTNRSKTRNTHMISRIRNLIRSKKRSDAVRQKQGLLGTINRILGNGRRWN